MADKLVNIPVTKLKFYAYKDAGFTELDKALTFEVQFNPNEFGYTFNIEYNKERPQNATDAQQTFRRAKPTDLAIDFTLDGTGAAGKNHANYQVKDKVDEFFKVVVDYSSDKHRPRYVMLHWGKMVFKGVVNSVNVRYNLFTPDGNPLRAKITLRLSSALSYEKQVAENSPDSPDMTHIRNVIDGDNIPLMTYDIYSDTNEYVKIARYNNLVNFRRLSSGQKLSFPPLIEKEK
ncbi:hypothetical protein N9164_04270 [Draconibacterium sp.]|nr:hypothetical protein [Draconibacterium sp.]